MPCAIDWCPNSAKPIRFSSSMRRAAKPPGSILDPTQTFASAASGRRPPRPCFPISKLFELRTVALPTIMVDLRVQQQHWDILFRNAAHRFARNADDEGVVGKFLPFRDQRRRSAQGLTSELSA